MRLNTGSIYIHVITLGYKKSWSLNTSLYTEVLAKLGLTVFKEYMSMLCKQSKV